MVQRTDNAGEARAFRAKGFSRQETAERYESQWQRRAPCSPEWAKECGRDESEVHTQQFLPCGERDNRSYRDPLANEGELAYHQGALRNHTARFFRDCAVRPGA